MVPSPPPGDSRRPAGMTRVLARNIQALLARRHTEEQARRPQDRMADAITRFPGSIAFVVIHLLYVPRFDPSFVILATEASVEAIFLSTFVLISQNRMTALADKRTDLDLQVSLLAEHEVTRLISLVTATAQDVAPGKASEGSP